MPWAKEHFLRPRGCVSIQAKGPLRLSELIDAHAHLMRAAETWAIEARFDAVPEPEVGVPSIGPKPAA
jgi:hypothetical protein